VLETFTKLGIEATFPQEEIMKKVISCALAFVVATLLFTGCASSNSARAKPIEPIYSASDLSRYTVATVVPFDYPNRKPDQGNIGAEFADNIAIRLAQDFGPIFQQVRTGNPSGEPNELIVSGIIQEYTPGSRIGRAFGPGITPAKFKGEVVMKDGVTRNPVLIIPIEKFWAWGHTIGAAKGIEDMTNESAAAVANTVARAKGWTPPSAAGSPPP
jgi:hypothetical protein